MNYRFPTYSRESSGFFFYCIVKWVDVWRSTLLTQCSSMAWFLQSHGCGRKSFESNGCFQCSRIWKFIAVLDAVVQYRLQNHWLSILKAGEGRIKHVLFCGTWIWLFLWHQAAGVLDVGERWPSGAGALDRKAEKHKVHFNIHIKCISKPIVRVFLGGSFFVVVSGSIYSLSVWFGWVFWDRIFLMY